MDKVLVIDANVLFSALIKGEFTLQLIYLLKSAGYKLVSPKAVLDEIEENKEKILKYSEFSSEEIDFILELLGEVIEFIPKERLDFEEAKKICSDKDDVPYLALALSLGKVFLWSNDKDLKEDCEKVGIIVLSTEDIKLVV